MPALPKYTRHMRACVNGNNLQLFPNETPESCAFKCEQVEACVGFEFGVDYGGESDFKFQPNACQLSSSVEMLACNGGDLNLDMYTSNAHYTLSPSPPPPVPALPKYTQHEGRCVRGNNIKHFADKSPEQCATICEATAACVGFEYGVDYGGDAFVYSNGVQHRARDCTLSSSTIMGDCNGRALNMDMYTQNAVYLGEPPRPPSPPAPLPAMAPAAAIKLYTQHVGRCVRGSNIKHIYDKSPAECASLCEDAAGCVGFEYGVDHGGDDAFTHPDGNLHRVRDCMLSSSVDMGDCDGKALNMDMYTKTSVYKPEAHTSPQPEAQTLPQPQPPLVQPEPPQAAAPSTSPAPLPVTTSALHLYTRHDGRCVRGHNLRHLTGKSPAECALLCEATVGCVGFEYGADHGATEVFVHPDGERHRLDDCMLSSSTVMGDCDGKALNMDMYTKISEYQKEAPATTERDPATLAPGLVGRLRRQMR
jgi:hypothetical protein